MLERWIFVDPLNRHNPGSPEQAAIHEKSKQGLALKIEDFTCQVRALVEDLRVRLHT